MAKKRGRGQLCDWPFMTGLPLAAVRVAQLGRRKSEMDAGQLPEGTSEQQRTINLMRTFSNNQMDMGGVWGGGTEEKKILNSLSLSLFSLLRGSGSDLLTAPCCR